MNHVHCKVHGELIYKMNLLAIPLTMMSVEFSKQELTSMSNRHLTTESKEDCRSDIDLNLVVAVSHCFGQYKKFYGSVNSTVSIVESSDVKIKCG